MSATDDMAAAVNVDPQAIEAAASRLAAGELVAFPTETVYGLGARADDDAAVARIFEAKGRPADHPLIVHLPDAQAAAHFAPELPALAQRLMVAFWPGPLTLIVPRRPDRGRAAAGGQDSIGLRCPSHPVALALLRAAQVLGVPGVAAPSANRYGRISPTRAAHVVEEFGESVHVLDGGPCAVGIESTIIDCTRGHPVLLRPGVLGAAQIEAVAGEAVRPPDAQAPRASGTLASHYAPRARLRLMTTAELRAALDLSADALQKQSPPTVAIYSRTVAPVAGLVQRRMPDHPEAAAFELFAVLRELDALGVALIWVESPPDEPAWLGVRDRLSRAAA